MPAGARPHDVAPAPDGTVWYTGQRNGTMGRLDPATTEIVEVELPDGAAPHGVIVGPDGSIWVTDQGLNSLLRIDPDTLDVETLSMPDGQRASPHTPTIDADGSVWFTGQNGFIGRYDPGSGEMSLYPTPRGAGPYGIDTTPGDEVWFVSLGQSYLAQVDRTTGEMELFEPPTAGQGARRVWADSIGRLWLTEWNAGNLAMHDPSTGEWREWPMPAPDSQPYAIYVDELDLVWITDFGSNAIVRFDPATEEFASFEIPTPNAQVRQLLGRDGELWGAESATDKLVVLRWPTSQSSG